MLCKQYEVCVIPKKRLWRWNRGGYWLWKYADWLVLHGNTIYWCVWQTERKGFILLSMQICPHFPHDLSSRVFPLHLKLSFSFTLPSPSPVISLFPLFISNTKTYRALWRFMSSASRHDQSSWMKQKLKLWQLHKLQQASHDTRDPWWSKIAFGASTTHAYMHKHTHTHTHKHTDLSTAIILVTPYI